MVDFFELIVMLDLFELIVGQMDNDIKCITTRIFLTLD